MMTWLKRLQRILIGLLIFLPWYAVFINLILIDIRRVELYGYGLLLGFVLQLVLTYHMIIVRPTPLRYKKLALGCLLGLIVIGSFFVHYLPLRLL